MTFNEFNFKEQLQDAIESAGFKEPSPIQEQAIPVALKGCDILGSAQTGTGKTASFAIDATISSASYPVLIAILNPISSTQEIAIGS